MMDYELTIKGQLDLSYAAWFGNLGICHEDGNTVLTAVNIDQATLYGIILRCRDLGLTLLALHQTRNGQPTTDNGRRSSVVGRPSSHLPTKGRKP